MVSARAAMYVAGAMLAAGLAGGWFLGRSPIAKSWASVAPEVLRPPVDLGASQGGSEEGLSLTVMDRTGRTVQSIAADRPWTPRISRDGRRVVYGAFAFGRSTSDLWVTDLKGGATRRLTDGDDDANDPQWSPDGERVVYSATAPGGKDLLERTIGAGASRVIAARVGTQFASDWRRDGKALLVTEDAPGNGHDIIVQPVDGATAWPFVATPAEETAARVSPDGRWVAYTSDASGRAEVYLDSWPRPTRRITLSSGGGLHPVWRGDGRELYYWNAGALMAVQLGAAWDATPPTVGARSVLFRAPYHAGLNTMYDVSPDGERFVIVQER